MFVLLVLKRGLIFHYKWVGECRNSPQKHLSISLDGRQRLLLQAAHELLFPHLSRLVQLLHPAQSIARDICSMTQAKPVTKCCVNINSTTEFRCCFVFVANFREEFREFQWLPAFSSTV